MARNMYTIYSVTKSNEKITKGLSFVSSFVHSNHVHRGFNLMCTCMQLVKCHRQIQL